MSLKTDYKDYIPSTPLRKYTQIDNDDGTISLQDVTDYTQVGDKSGASVFNGIGTEVNGHILNLDAHVSTYIHTKTGTVHDLSGTGNNVEFLATAGISDGDTWTVNGTAVTATLQNGEVLPADLFKSDSWVTGVRLDGAKLGFKSAGGNTIEVFNFPLTIDPAMPTPADAKANGHIWVIGNEADFTKIKLAQGVTLGDDGTLYLSSIPPNSSEVVTQSKKVGATKIAFTSERNPANTVDMPWKASSVNSNGTVIDISMQIPLVYSRLSGVLDMCTAYMWDGTQWLMISQKGSYVYTGGVQVSGYYSDAIFNRIGNSLVSHPQIFQESYSINDMARSENGLTIVAAVNVAGRILGRFRQGDSFIPISFLSADGSALPTLVFNSIAITKDASCIAAGAVNGNTFFFKKVTNTEYRITTYYSASGSVQSLDFNYDGSRIAIGHSYVSGYTALVILSVANQIPVSLLFGGNVSTRNAYYVKFIPNSNDLIVHWPSTGLIPYRASGYTYSQGSAWSNSSSDYRKQTFDITNDGKYILFVNTAFTLFVVEIITMTLINQLIVPTTPCSLKLSDDNKLILIGAYGYNTFQLFSLSSDFATNSSALTLLQTITLTSNAPNIVGFIS